MLSRIRRIDWLAENNGIKDIFIAPSGKNEMIRLTDVSIVEGRDIFLVYINPCRTSDRIILF